jgi:hypothetical protein
VGVCLRLVLLMNRAVQFPLSLQRYPLAAVSSNTSSCSCD